MSRVRVLDGSSGLISAALIAALAGGGFDVAQGAMTNMAPAQPNRRRAPTDTTHRYFGMTKEQADWNAAIDKKKAGKP